jgi:hypothetical protein
MLKILAWVATWSARTFLASWSASATRRTRRLERERDEAREKYDMEATEHMLAVNKLCNDRDKALKELELIKEQYGR